MFKVVQNFLRSRRFYFDYFARWGNLGLVRFFYEFRCAINGNDFQTESEMEMILHTNVYIYIEYSMRYFFPFMFYGSVQDARIYFFKLSFARKLCLHFHFQNGPRLCNMR